MLWIKYSLVVVGAVIADAVVAGGFGEDVDLKDTFASFRLAAIRNVAAQTPGDTGDSKDGERGRARRLNRYRPNFTFQAWRARIGFLRWRRRSG